MPIFVSIRWIYFHEHHNINKDSGIEIPKAWIPTIKRHSSRSITNRSCEGTTSIRNNNEDRNEPTATDQRGT